MVMCVSKKNDVTATERIVKANGGVNCSICVNSVSYKENLKLLGILPFPMYVQLNNLLLLFKIDFGTL